VPRASWLTSCELFEGRRNRKEGATIGGILSSGIGGVRPVFARETGRVHSRGGHGISRGREGAKHNTGKRAVESQWQN